MFSWTQFLSKPQNVKFFPPLIYEHSQFLTHRHFQLNDQSQYFFKNNPSVFITLFRSTRNAHLFSRHKLCHTHNFYDGAIVIISQQAASHHNSNDKRVSVSHWQRLTAASTDQVTECLLNKWGIARLCLVCGQAKWPNYS